MLQLKKRSILAAVLLNALLLSLPAQANWTGQGEFGLVMSRGNTNADTGNLKFNFTTEFPRWKHSAMARLLYGQSNGIQAAERWETAWQTEFRLNNRPFVFGSVRFEEDEFGGFASQSTASTGLGYNLIETRSTTLSCSFGAGYRRAQSQQLMRDEAGNVIERIAGDVTENAVSKAGLNYRQQLTESTTIINNFLVESGTSNTLAQNDLALQVAMTRKLALGIGYSLRHNAQPPQGLKETDQLTTVNLVYKIQ